MEQTYDSALLINYPQYSSISLEISHQEFQFRAEILPEDDDH
jgi:hypothetical protein